MKNILLYGDSNIFGYNPVTELRYPLEERWTFKLAERLGKEYYIIPEGLNSRTTIFSHPDCKEDIGKSGKDYLLPCLQSHQPLDLVVIMLGTNDTKRRYNATPADIAKGIEELGNIVVNPFIYQTAIPPELLVLSPPHINSNIRRKNELFFNFGKQAIKKSESLAENYRAICDKNKWHFLDIGRHVTASNMDGVHLDKNGCDKFAEVMHIKIHDIFLKINQNLEV